MHGHPNPSFITLLMPHAHPSLSLLYHILFPPAQPTGSTNMQWISAEASSWKIHINLKHKGFLIWPFKTSKHALKVAGTPIFFHRFFLKDGGWKQKANSSTGKLLVSALSMGWCGSQESSCFSPSPQPSAPPDTVLAWSIPKGYSTSCPGGEQQHKGLVTSLGHNLC